MIKFMPGQSSIDGNEKSNEVARAASDRGFIDLELIISSTETR